MPIEHVEIPVGEIHKPHNWEYADATAREAATGFVPEDVGKQALQLDDFSRWTLTDDDPATWQSDTAAGSPGLHAASHENGGSDEIDVTGLSGVLADPQVADSIVESGGPTTLTVGAVADGEFLKRDGSTIVGDAGGGGGGSIAPLTIIDANTVHQKNGTTAQTLAVFKTTTNNYRLEFVNVSGQWEIASKSDAGTPDPVRIRIAATQTYSFGASNFLPPTDTSTALGAGGTRWGTAYVTGVDASSSGDIRWSNSTRLLAPSNGILRVVGDSSSTGHIVLGTVDTSGIRLKQNGTRLEVKLGGDSAYTQLTCEKLGVNNSAAATSLGSVAKKMEVFDAAGASLGFVPIYDAIT